MAEPILQVENMAEEYSDAENSTVVPSTSDDIYYIDDNSDANGSNFAVICVIMVMLALFSIVGVTGNALVLYVYSQKRDRQVANHFIIVLAIVDFVTCSIAIPFTIYYEYVGKEMSSDLLCKLYHFLITSIIPFSVLIMVAIAVDRYFCICHPFMQALTLPRAKIVTVTMAVFSIGLGIIVACMHGVYTMVPKSSLFESYDDYNNLSEHIVTNDTSDYDTEEEMVKAYVGHCIPSTVIFDASVMLIYHRFHTALYLICLIVIIVLYALIYKLVRARRARRLQQQSTRLLQVNHDSTFSGSPMTDIVTLNGEGSQKPCNGKVDQENKSPGNSIKSQNSPPHSDANRSPPASKKGCPWANDTRRDSRRERMRIANLKTAAMLFVVTVVFVITYMPAFVMSMIHKVNIIAFYLYFANNVANPVIYSFMNKNFREDLVRIFKKTR